MNKDPKDFLLNLFNSAIAAAHPSNTLVQHLPSDTSRAAIVIGAGKAAAAMATQLEQHWQGPLSGLVVTRYGHSEPCHHIEVIEAAHPIPDQIGQDVATKMLRAVQFSKGFGRLLNIAVLIVYQIELGSFADSSA